MSSGAGIRDLAAQIGRNVVGHVAFSPVTISDGTPDWYGVGPISVLPKYQRQGIGTALMNEGLSRLKARGAKGCALVGEPEYYKRFGFRNLPTLTLEGVPQKYFLALSFTKAPPTAAVTFHKAFTAQA